MSFISGYILGSDRIKEIDPRIKKLDAHPSLCTFDIADGWNVRIKIASDVDNARYFSFGSTAGEIAKYIEMWSFYYCVYKDNAFKFASCETAFCSKFEKDTDVVNNKYYIKGYSDFCVTSGEKAFKNSGVDFLTIRIYGTMLCFENSYSCDEDGNRITESSESHEGAFFHVRNDFGGTYDRGVYIVNGGPEELKEAVCGLYSACRSCI